MSTFSLQAPSLKTPNWSFLIWAIIALTGIRLVTLVLSPLDLFPDEAQYWDWSRDPAWGYFSKPPLIGWIINASTSLCGHGEACIRATSPLLHGLTALFVGLAARRLFDETTAVWSGLVYLTLPGVFFSAGFVSTDVPLLTALSASLWALARFRDTGSWGDAALIGLFLGFGFLAKYAALYFFGGIVLWAILSEDARSALFRPQILAAGLSFFVVIANNLLWNQENGFVTIAHTADNANWGADLLNPGKAAEFVGAQFGVFGPILFACLILVTIQASRRPVPDAVKLCLALSVPIVLVVSLQALVSRAHANWAAAAYVAASPVVCWYLVHHARTHLLRLSVALHLVLGLSLYGFSLGANTLALVPGIDPFHRVVAWKDTAAAVQALTVEQGPFDVILSDDRRLMAALVYELRDWEGQEGPPLKMWYPGETPGNHYAMDRPFEMAPFKLEQGNRVLFVNRFGFPAAIAPQFAASEKLAEIAIPIRPWRTRPLHFSLLEGPL